MIADVSGVKRRFRKLIQQPSLLVHDGKVIESHMAKEHVRMDDLREHGISSRHDVAVAVLEVDGSSISRLKYDEIKPDANTHLVQHRRFLQKDH